MHDPTTLAWLIVLAYAAGAVLAVAAMRCAAEPRERRFWVAAAVLLALLGLNKQLDLQTAMVDLGRELARAQGWYGVRRYVQGAVLLVLGAGAAMVAGLLGTSLSRAGGSVRLAGFGMLLLMAFVLVRAASFHHIDAWVTVNVAGLRSGWWLELAGIGVVAASAIAFRKSAPAAPEP